MGIPSLFSGNMLVLAPSVPIVLIANHWFGLPLKTLTGLRRYFIAGSDRDTRTALLRAQKVNPRRNKKMLQDDTDTLLVTPFTAAEASQVKYFGNVEVALYLIELAFVTFFFTEAFPSVFVQSGFEFNPLPLVLGAAAVLYALFSLFNVDLFGKHTSPEDRWLTLAFSAGAFGASAYVLQKKPIWAPTADLGKAAGYVATLVQEAIEAAVPASEGSFSVPEVSEGQLCAALAVVSLVLALALFLPALRFVLSFKLNRDAPAWFPEYAVPTSNSTALLTVQFVGPLVASMLWGRLRPNMVLSIHIEEERKIFSAALLTLAVVQLSAARQVLQHYLDSALIAWYNLRNPTTAEGEQPKRLPRVVSEIVRTRIRIINGLVGRAAVEVVMPAVIYLGLGLALVWCSVHSDIASDADVTLIVDAVVGYLSWWCCTLTFLYHGAHMWLFKAGVNA